jgi:hypothetical protein
MVESGMALAWGLEHVVIGQRQSAFDHLAQTIVIPTWQEFIEWLQLWRN